MSDRLKRLLEDRARAWEAMQAISAAADKDKRSELSAEERAAWDKAEADIASISSDIERDKRAAALGATFAELADDKPELRGAGSAPEARVEAPELAEKRYESAFSSYMRNGLDGLSVEDRSLMVEKRAQTTTTTTAGGFFVPQGYWERISETMKAFGGLLSVANVIDTATGQILPWPNNDDTANTGRILGEGIAVTETDVTIGQRSLNAFTYTSDSILASLQLVQDSAFDLDTFIERKLAMRIGRRLANDLVNGAGTTLPKGISVAPVVGVTAANATSQVTAVTYNSIIDLIHSVDAAYRQLGNCRFLLNDLSLAVLRKLADTQGRPLWQPAVTDADPDRFAGYPVQVDNAVAVMGVSAKSIYFGDFNLGYVVRRVRDVTLLRLTERYADQLAVGYISFARFDGQPDDPSAVKVFVNAAS